MDKLKELAIATWRLKKWVASQEIERKLPAESSIRSIESILADHNVRVVDLTGEAYDQGLAVEVIHNEGLDVRSNEAPIITDMLQPIIMLEDTVAEFGQVVIGDKIKGKADPMTFSRALGEAIKSDKKNMQHDDNHDIEAESNDSKETSDKTMIGNDVLSGYLRDEQASVTSETPTSFGKGVSDINSKGSDTCKGNSGFRGSIRRKLFWGFSIGLIFLLLINSGISIAVWFAVREQLYILSSQLSESYDVLAEIDYRYEGLVSDIKQEKELLIEDLFAACVAAMAVEDELSDEEAGIIDIVEDDNSWQWQMYVVKAGDTLYSITQQFGLDYNSVVNEVREKNDLENENRLFIGQKLQIPILSYSN